MLKHDVCFTKKSRCPSITFFAFFSWNTFDAASKEIWNISLFTLSKTYITLTCYSRKSRDSTPSIYSLNSWNIIIKNLAVKSVCYNTIFWLMILWWPSYKINSKLLLHTIHTGKCSFASTSNFLWRQQKLYGVLYYNQSLKFTEKVNQDSNF